MLPTNFQGIPTTPQLKEALHRWADAARTPEQSPRSWLSFVYSHFNSTSTPSAIGACECVAMKIRDMISQRPELLEDEKSKNNICTIQQCLSWISDDIYRSTKALLNNLELEVYLHQQARVKATASSSMSCTSSYVSHEIPESTTWAELDTLFNTHPYVRYWTCEGMQGTISSRALKILISLQLEQPVKEVFETTNIRPKAINAESFTTTKGMLLALSDEHLRSKVIPSDSTFRIVLNGEESQKFSRDTYETACRFLDSQDQSLITPENASALLSLAQIMGNEKLITACERPHSSEADVMIAEDPTDEILQIGPETSWNEISMAFCENSTITTVQLMGTNERISRNALYRLFSLRENCTPKELFEVVTVYVLCQTKNSSFCVTKGKLLALSGAIQQSQIFPEDQWEPEPRDVNHPLAHQPRITKASLDTAIAFMATRDRSLVTDDNAEELYELALWLDIPHLRICCAQRLEDMIFQQGTEDKVHRLMYRFPMPEPVRDACEQWLSKALYHAQGERLDTLISICNQVELSHLDLTFFGWRIKATQELEFGNRLTELTHVQSAKIESRYLPGWAEKLAQLSLNQLEVVFFIPFDASYSARARNNDAWPAIQVVNAKSVSLHVDMAHLRENNDVVRRLPITKLRLMDKSFNPRHIGYLKGLRLDELHLIECKTVYTEEDLTAMQELPIKSICLPVETNQRIAGVQEFYDWLEYLAPLQHHAIEEIQIYADKEISFWSGGKDAKQCRERMIQNASIFRLFPIKRCVTNHLNSRLAKGLTESTTLEELELVNIESHDEPEDHFFTIDEDFGSDVNDDEVDRLQEAATLNLKHVLERNKRVLPIMRLLPSSENGLELEVYPDYFIGAPLRHLKVSQDEDASTWIQALQHFPLRTLTIERADINEADIARIEGKRITELKLEHSRIGSMRVLTRIDKLSEIWSCEECTIKFGSQYEDSDSDPSEDNPFDRPNTFFEDDSEHVTILPKSLPRRTTGNI